MADIEHSLDADSVIELGEDFPNGQFLKFEGSGSSIKVFLEPKHLQRICNELSGWGYQPKETKTTIMSKGQS